MERRPICPIHSHHKEFAESKASKLGSRALGGGFIRLECLFTPCILKLTDVLCDLEKESDILRVLDFVYDGGYRITKWHELDFQSWISRADLARACVGTLQHDHSIALLFIVHRPTIMGSVRCLR